MASTWPHVLPPPLLLPRPTSITLFQVPTLTHHQHQHQHHSLSLPYAVSSSHPPPTSSPPLSPPRSQAPIPATSTQQPALVIQFPYLISIHYLRTQPHPARVSSPSPSPSKPRSCMPSCQFPRPPFPPATTPSFPTNLVPAHPPDPLTQYGRVRSRLRAWARRQTLVRGVSDWGDGSGPRLRLDWGRQGWGGASGGIQRCGLGCI